MGEQKDGEAVSEQFEDAAHERGPQEDATSGALTGDAGVDAVLRSLDDLADRPVEEHVAIFESAHETLRAALADAGDRPAGPAVR